MEDKFTEASESGIIEMDEGEMKRDLSKQIMVDMKLGNTVPKVYADWLARRTADLVNTDYFD